MKRVLLTLALCVVAVTAAAQETVHERNVAVPMRDGVVLRADVLRPPGPGPFPVLVYRTPYGKDDAIRNSWLWKKAVARGYAVVAQDVRGRYASDGEYLAYQNEGRDGYDTIEWAAAQPWSNGAVGTFGLSYPGAVQWLAAMERPPHLKAMVPAMTFSTPRNFFYSGGVFDMSWIGWIWNNIAPDVRVKKNLPGPRTGREARAEFEKLRTKFQAHLPLNTLAELKDVAPWYYEWLKHPAGDAWWDWAELRGRYERVAGVAVLNFSGWYDEAYGPEGATTNFRGLLAARSGEKEPRAALVMGPWAHGVPGPEDRVVGERDFGPSAVIDYDAMVLDWMDRYVKGVAPSPPGKPVRYFVMGPNEWREADTWPLPQTRSTPFYLSHTRYSGPGLGRALLPKKPSTRRNFTEFSSHPADPTMDPHPPYTGGNDYSELAKSGRAHYFDTEPLKADLEVTGHIAAEIYISTDAPDTDLWVRLLDVNPDGKAINLMSPGLDVIRASYRNGTAQQELLEPGKVYKLTLPNLITSNVFRKGHRIRVQISSSFFPNFSRNLHSGKLETESDEKRLATIRIHHDSRYASRVILPIIRSAKQGAW